MRGSGRGGRARSRTRRARLGTGLRVGAIFSRVEAIGRRKELVERWDVGGEVRGERNGPDGAHLSFGNQALKSNFMIFFVSGDKN